MGTRIFRPLRAMAAGAVGLAVVATLVVGCTGSPGSTAATTAGSAAPSAATVAGPTDYAAWVERQGFGGSAGLANVAKLAHWVQDNPGEQTAWQAGDDAAQITSLISWLDAHPATSCWADYHDTVRSLLNSLTVSYAATKVELAAGRQIPSDMVASMIAVADKAKAMAPPAGCK